MYTRHFLFRLPNLLVIIVVRLYQQILSPDHGAFRIFFPNGYCRFYPTCSQYGLDAFERHRFFKALFLTSWRILRCNPLSKGGIDFVSR